MGGSYAKFVTAWATLHSGAIIGTRVQWMMLRDCRLSRTVVKVCRSCVQLLLRFGSMVAGIIALVMLLVIYLVLMGPILGGLLMLMLIGLGQMEIIMVLILMLMLIGLGPIELIMVLIIVIMDLVLIMLNIMGVVHLSGLRMIMSGSRMVLWSMIHARGS